MSQESISAVELLAKIRRGEVTAAEAEHFIHGHATTVIVGTLDAFVELSEALRAVAGGTKVDTIDTSNTRA